MDGRFGRGCSVGDNPRATAEVSGGADKARKGLEFGLAGLNSEQVGISAARDSLAGHFAHLQPHSPLAPPPQPPLSGATEGAACFSPLSDHA
jgi:hypothetical protein